MTAWSAMRDAKFVMDRFDVTAASLMRWRLRDI